MCDSIDMIFYRFEKKKQLLFAASFAAFVLKNLSTEFLRYLLDLLKAA